MNELEKDRYYTLWAKPDWRLGGDRKTTGKIQRYTKNSHQQVFLDSKIFFAQMTGEGTNIISSARYQHNIMVNDDVSKKNGRVFRKSI